MVRYVVLQHETPKDHLRPTHWDFMLESGGTLRHTGGGNAQLYSDITIGAGGGTIGNNGNEFRTRTTVQTGGNNLTLDSISTIRFDGNGNIQSGAAKESLSSDAAPAAPSSFQHYLWKCNSLWAKKSHSILNSLS